MVKLYQLNWTERLKIEEKKVVEMDGFGYSIQDIHVITFEVKIEMKAKQK